MEPTLIAAGGYGCVFRPSFACNGKTEPGVNRVTKIQAADAAARNELAIAEIIRKIPDYKRFFGVAVSSCSVNRSVISKGVLKQCPLLSHGQKFLLITFDYIPNVSMQRVALAALQRKEDIYALLHSYSLLLRSIIKLSGIGVLHMDLKPDNILYDAIYHLPVIIDFGIAVDMERLTPAEWKDKFYTFSPEYFIWAPEIQYIAYLLHVNPSPSDKEIHLFSTSIVTNNRALDDFTSEFKELWAEDCYRFFVKFLDTPRDEVITHLLSFWKTWDNYALSAMYMRLLQSWHSSGYTDNWIFGGLVEIFLWGMHPSPSARYTPDKSVSEYNRIFRTEEDASCVIQEMEEFVQGLKLKEI
jgi:serine/threonine protein kinase